MPLLRIYRVFISHAWIYNNDYYTLERMFKNANNFFYWNYSVPEHDPLIITNKDYKKQLEEGLYRQIRPSQIVIIISGMYVLYREWIQKEIDIALEMNKPIVGIKPWGRQRVPQAVQLAANEMVCWNTNSIVNAIRRWAI